jgi:hypothetical protein
MDIRCLGASQATEPDALVPARIQLAEHKPVGQVLDRVAVSVHLELVSTLGVESAADLVAGDLGAE